MVVLASVELLDFGNGRVSEPFLGVLGVAVRFTLGFERRLGLEFGLMFRLRTRDTDVDGGSLCSAGRFRGVLDVDAFVVDDDDGDDADVVAGIFIDINVACGAGKAVPAGKTCRLGSRTLDTLG